MSRYPAHYDSYLRAHFQGIGAATAGSGIGINEPQTIFGLPMDPSITSAPPDGYVLTYSATQGYWTVKLGGSALANPTAVASDVAVNGVATTAMRSDAAPAVQKATASQFGLVKPDGTTITISSGIISIPSSVALPGSPTTTTQSSSDNSTKLATTQFVQNVTAGGFVPTGAAFHPGFASGQFYFSPDVLSGAGAGNVTVSASTLYGVPFFVPTPTTFNTIGIHCTSGVAASSIQLGVYNNANGVPTSLVKDCGNVATTGVGDVTINSLNMTLSAGWYWLALGADASHTPGFSCVVGSTSISASLWFLGCSTSAPSASTNSIKNTWTPGALPNTFPLTGVSYGTGSWLIFLKM